jgi:hypothetical protein
MATRIRISAIPKKIVVSRCETSSQSLIIIKTHKKLIILIFFVLNHYIITHFFCQRIVSYQNRTPREIDLSHLLHLNSFINLK